MWLRPTKDGQIFAPRQLLLHCPNKLHPCNDGNICTSTFRGGRIPQGAKDGGVVISNLRSKQQC
jgi:hypothetical protein